MIRFFFRHKFSVVETVAISVASHLILEGFWIAAFAVLLPVALFAARYQDAANA